jgi:hypothetical protein
MTRTTAGSLVALALLVAVGCNKEGGDAAPGASAKPGGASTAASNLPVKGPWEAIKITMTKKDADGTAHFRVDNLGAKTVTQLFIDKYGYDAKGKQVVHKDLGFSLPIKGGASEEFTQDPVKDVDTWEAVYHGIGFEGDAKETMDYKRAPAQRPKGAP